MTANEVQIKKTDYKWHGSPVTYYSGTIDQLKKYVPEFERRSFGVAITSFVEPTGIMPPGKIVTQGINPWRDVIIRKTYESDVEKIPEIPVGIVSPQYTLLQHHKVIDEVVSALDQLRIQVEDVKASMVLSYLGERMRFSIVLPDKFSIDIGREDRLGLRLECFNSVEGSTRFWALIGWLRFVCENGMVAGDIKTDYRRRHNQAMNISEIHDVLNDGLAEVTLDKQVFDLWMQHKVTREQISDWVNGHVAKQWGAKAAVRAWHITNTGFDASLANPFEKGKPTEKTIIKGTKVPGSILPGNNVFAVAQSLSWLAKERRDVQEQLLWKQQIPKLIEPLLSHKAAYTVQRA